ncbi:unnamed protein product, partial [marine sediment metagenome]
MNGKTTKQTGFLNIRTIVWVVTSLAGLACAVLLCALWAERTQTEHAQTLRQLSELQTRLAQREAQFQELSRANVMLSESLEAERSEQQVLQTSWQGTLDGMTERLT